MFRGLFFLVFLVEPLSVSGQGFFLSEFYSPKEYEFHFQVYEVEQDSNQNIFFGTGSGYSIFNGNTFKSFHIGESGRGTSFLNSSKGTIYASGQYDFGIISHDSLNNSKYSSISKDFYDTNDLMNEHFSTFEYDNAIYFYGWNGLEVLKNDSLRFYPLDNISFPKSFLFDDRIFVSSALGLHEFRNQSFSLIPGSVILEESRNTFVLNGLQGKALLGYYENGIYSFNGYSFSKFYTEIEEYLTENKIYDASFINDSLVVIGTISGGLTIIDLNGKVEHIYNSNTGFEQQGVLSTYIDHEQTLWLGLWGGIEKVLSNIPIYKYSEKEGIDSEVLEIFFENGNIYTRSINRISKSETLSFERALKFKEVPTLKRVTGSTNMLDLNDQLFFSSGEGIFRLNEAQESELIYRGKVNDLVENLDDPSELTFITDSALVFKRKNEYLYKPVQLSSPRIEDAILKDETLFFISNSEFIYRLSNDSLSVVEIENNIDFKTIYNHLGIINDEIYVATQGAEENGGLYRYNKDINTFEKATEFGTSDKAVTSKQVLTFDQCENGDIWVHNDKQVKRIRKVGEEWIVQKSPYQLIGEGDGIYSIKCEDDGVWFGGVNGLYHLTDPDWDYKTDFKTNITDIYVNRDSLIYGGFGEPVKPIVLPYKDNEVRFNYAAASYIDETRNTYSYKLEGFDNDWSEWSLETQKDYTNIPEGEYIFKVRSKNVFEVDGRPDQIAFTVLPPWYRTWWAYMLYFISFSGLLYTGYKIRVNQLLKVERMRNKIASDLHDEVSATLTGISYFAEAIKRDKDQSRAAHFVSLISESAGDAKEKITDIVWSINPENDSWELFLSKCRRFASDLLESKELEYSLNITENVPGKLGMEVRQHLWMIFKEMVTNAVRHSTASRLDVIMDIENGMLKLIVQDNGMGFDSDETKDGNGIRNIRKRAAKIGAVITIHSEEDFGTRWRMELPL